MVVWRVQNSDGKGPYSTEHEHKWPLGTAHSNDEHPTPGYDGIAYYGQSWFTGKWHVCGFARKKDLRVWFDGWLDKLATTGFKIVKYKVSAKNVCKGIKQLTFVQNEAQLLSGVPRKGKE